MATNVDYLFVADLDDKGVVNALDRIDKRVTKLGTDATKVFSGINSDGVSAFNQIKIAANNAFQTIQNTSKQSAQGISNLNSQLNQLQTTLNGISGIQLPNVPQTPVTPSTPLSTTPTSQVPVNDLTGRIAENLRSAQVPIGDIDKLTPDDTDLQATEEAIRKVRNALLELGEENADTAETFTKFVKELDLFDDSIVDTATKLGLVQREIDSFQNKLDEGLVTESDIQQLNNLKTTAQSLQTELEKLALAGKTELINRKNLEQGGKDLLKIATNTPKVNSAIQQLVQKYGNFTLKIDQNGKVLNKQSAEFLKLTRTVPGFNNQVRQLAQQYGGLTSKINASTAKLNTFNQTAKQTSNGFSTILKGFVFFRITQGIEQAGQALKNLLVDASNVATEFELLEKSFVNIFGQENQQIAKDFFEIVRQESERLGADLAGIASTLAPRLGSTDEFRIAAEAAIGLKALSEIRGQPKSQQEAVRAINEALAEQFVSLQRLFNLSGTQLDKVRDAYRESGNDTTVFFETLNQVLAEEGVNIDDLLNNIKGRSGQIREVFASLKATTGEIINEKVVDFLTQLIEFIQDNRAEFEELAVSIGILSANLAQLAEDLFFDNVDTDGLQDLIDVVQELNTAILSIQVVLQNDTPQFGNQISSELTKPLAPASILIARIEDMFRLFTIPLKIAFGEEYEKTISKVIDYTNNAVENFGDLQSIIETFLKTKSLVVAYGQAIFDFLVAPIKSLTESFSVFINEGIVEGLKTAFGSIIKYKDAIEVLKTEGLSGNFFNELIKASDSATDTIQGTVDKLEEIENIKIEQEILIESKLEETQPNKDAVDALLAQRQKAAEEQSQLDEETQKRAEDILKKRLEIEKKFAEDQIKLEIENAQKREKIERDLSDKLGKVRQDYDDDVEDAVTDFNRDLEDIQDDFEKDQIEQQKENADKRADVWKEYYRTLEDLRRQFEFDASEAIRQNDAIRFLQLKRRLQFEQNEARISRDRDLADAKDAEDKKNSELEQKRQDAIAEAEKALRRQLEDAQTAYTRAVRDAQTARDQDLRDLSIYNEEKLAEIKREYESELDEFESFRAEKEDRTEDWLNNELSIIESLNNDIIDKESELYKTRLGNFSTFIDDFENEYGRLADLVSSAASTSYTAPQNDGLSGVGGSPFDTETDEEYRDRLKKQAIGVYNFKNPNPDKDFIKGLDKYDIEELKTFIESAGITPLPRKNVKARKMGGSVLSQNTYLVGEQGAELLTIGQGFNGRVTPIRDPNNFTIPSYPLGGNSVNNSRNYNVDLSMLNPDALSPGQIAQITAIVQQVLLQATA